MRYLPLLLLLFACQPDNFEPIEYSVPPEIMDCATYDDGQDIEAIEKTVQENMYKSNTPWTIPIVFHIVNTNTTNTIRSMAQIYSCMESLNDAFANAGVWHSDEGVDMQIQFTHAGTFFHNGEQIWGQTYVQHGIRHSGSLGITSNTVRDYCIAQSGLSGTNYYHVIFPHKITSPEGGISGFASLGMQGTPTNFTLMSHITDTRYLSASGLPGNSNRVLIHEIGHNLSLRHTFEGNTCSTSAWGDWCDDTPPESGPVWNCGGTTCNGHNPRNHMSYNSCRNRFTECQKARAHATLNSWKSQWAGAQPKDEYPFTMYVIPMANIQLPTRWMYYGNPQEVHVNITRGDFDGAPPYALYRTSVMGGLSEGLCLLEWGNSVNSFGCFYDVHPVISQGERYSFITYNEGNGLKLWPEMWKVSQTGGNFQQVSLNTFSVEVLPAAPARQLYLNNLFQPIINYQP